MSDKVGARVNVWAYVIVPCVMFLLLICGSAILLNNAGRASDLILVFLVFLPTIVLVSLLITSIYQLCCDNKERENLPILFNMGEVRSIEIYGPEFGVPYYKQLTMPNFIGKPKSKKRKNAQASSSSGRTSTKLNYANYVDNYNQVKQSLMNFDDWTDALSEEPKDIEKALLVSTNKKRVRSKNKSKNIEQKPTVSVEVENSIKENSAPISEPVLNKRITKTKSNVSHKKNLEKEQAEPKYALKTYKSVPRPRYDDCVLNKVSYSANDRLLSTKLREKFAGDTTINAKSELLNKMRRQNNNILEK